MVVNIKDRTSELFSTIDAALNSRGYHDPLLVTSSSNGVRSPRAINSDFSKRSLSINNGIDKVQHKLTHFTKLIKSRGGGTGTLHAAEDEVDELANVIKRELAILNSQISDLQTNLKLQRSATYTVGTNKSMEEHSNQVIVSLQSRLAELSSSFTVVLEERGQLVRAARSRREQFSAVGANNIYSVPPRQRNVTTPSQSHVTIDLGEATSSGAGGSLQQLSLMTAAPDTAYLEGRSNALQGIESTINELGTIYRQLATMIAEQGEQVQRIDMNIEDMQINIERGQNELAKYLRRVSSNRWLMVKIFAILVLFVIFFNLFLI